MVSLKRSGGSPYCKCILMYMYTFMPMFIFMHLCMYIFMYMIMCIQEYIYIYVCISILKATSMFMYTELTAYPRLEHGDQIEGRLRKGRELRRHHAGLVLGAFHGSHERPGDLALGLASECLPISWLSLVKGALVI